MGWKVREVVKTVKELMASVEGSPLVIQVPGGWKLTFAGYVFCLQELVMAGLLDAEALPDIPNEDVEAYVDGLRVSGIGDEITKRALSAADQFLARFSGNTDLDEATQTLVVIMAMFKLHLNKGKRR